MTTQTTPKHIVFVVSNPTTSELTGWPIGFWLSELAHPFWEFSKRGYSIEIASPNGGAIVPDAMSDPEHPRGNPADFVSFGFKHLPRTAALLNATTPINQINVADYDAIFLVGGLGPMYTFIDNTDLHNLFVAFYEQGKVAAAVCHGTCVLLRAQQSDGRLLAEGKRWTGFSNREEDAVDAGAGRKVEPFRIEDEAQRMVNTTFVAGDPFKPFAIADGNLITGQQGSSGAETARLVIHALETAIA